MAETDWAQNLARAAQALEKAHAARDQVIRDAATAGLSPTAIARAVGLSRMQVYRIIDAETRSSG